MTPETRLVALFAQDEPPSPSAVRERLASLVRVTDAPPAEADWALEARVALPGAELVARVEPCEPPEIPEHRLARAELRSEGERVAAGAVRSAMSVTATLGVPVLKGYRAQLGLVAALAAGRETGVLDEGSGRFFAPVDLERLVATAAPPRARELQELHAVGPEKGKAPARLWLHTHGLARAGVPDLEALRVRARDQDAATLLLDTVAALLVAREVSARPGVIAVGEGLDVCLLELEDALARLPEGALGSDREDGDHAEPRLVLAPAAARKDGSVLELDLVLEALARVPVLYGSREEAERQAQVARERLPQLRKLFAKLAARPGHAFRVKLAHEAAGGGREHLWFRVTTFVGDGFEGVLESTPRRVSGLTSGARGRFSLDALSDWSVETPGGRIDPDAIDVAG